ncbi:MAG: hypothetical protein KGI08_11385 [Thaumarchaeota archaeon]|nr:hypothetical protein [Nitrososphaerota archaeon]
MTNHQNSISQAEIIQALEQFVKEGKLRKGWDKKGLLVYQDTRVKPTKGVRWIK